MLALPIGALKSLLVPSLSSSEQAEIAERYSSAREERMDLLKQAEKRREVIGSLFGKGNDGRSASRWAPAPRESSRDPVGVAVS